MMEFEHYSIKNWIRAMLDFFKSKMGDRSDLATRFFNWALTYQMIMPGSTRLRSSTWSCRVHLACWFPFFLVTAAKILQLPVSSPFHLELWFNNLLKFLKKVAKISRILIVLYQKIATKTQWVIFQNFGSFFGTFSRA